MHLVCYRAEPAIPMTSSEQARLILTRTGHSNDEIRASMVPLFPPPKIPVLRASLASRGEPELLYSMGQSLPDNEAEALPSPQVENNGRQDSQSVSH